MIRLIQQSDIFAYTETDVEAEPESSLNMMTGKNLMEVYYQSIPVFRCNMGHSIEDDVLFSRVHYRGCTAIISQTFREVSRKCGRWQPAEYFAGNAVANFCRSFSIDPDEFKAYLASRRKNDSAK